MKSNAPRLFFSRERQTEHWKQEHIRECTRRKKTYNIKKWWWQVGIYSTHIIGRMMTLPLLSLSLPLLKMEHFVVVPTVVVRVPRTGISISRVFLIGLASTSYRYLVSWFQIPLYEHDWKNRHVLYFWFLENSYKNWCTCEVLDPFVVLRSFLSQ